MDDPLLVGVRFALYTDLMLLCGLPAFALYALKPDERADPEVLPLRHALLAFAGAGLALTVFGLLIATASMMGISPTEVDATLLGSILFDTDMGWAAMVRTLAIGVVIIALIAFRRRHSLKYGTASLFGGLALIALVWNGHAGATEGGFGTIHRISDALHMVSAALWVGAIAAFVVMLARLARSPSETRQRTVERALNQFSRVGTILVAIVAGTGFINGQMIFSLAKWSQVIGTPYGQLLTVKLVLFAAMLLCAAANRWRLTPALEQSVEPSEQAQPVAALRRSLAVEAAAATLVLVLVAWLGTLSPNL